MLKPYGITTFCEDIRQEVGNKLTYVGVYQGGLTIDAAPPFSFDRMCYFTSVFIPNDRDFRNIWIELKFKRKASKASKTIVKIVPANQPKIPPSSKAEYLRANLSGELPEFRVSGDGHLLARCYIGDEEVKIGSMGIRFLKKRAANIRPKRGSQDD